MQGFSAEPFQCVALRSQLPAAILIPPVLGWVRLQGEVMGLYGPNIGVALFATSNVAVFSLLI